MVAAALQAGAVPRVYFSPTMQRRRFPRDNSAVASTPLPAALPEAAPAPGQHVGRGRLFRKYLLLILSLVMIALLASSAISLYFTYQETKSALASLQQEKAVGAASRIEQYIRQIEQQL